MYFAPNKCGKPRPNLSCIMLKFVISLMNDVNVALNAGCGISVSAVMR